MVVSRGPLNVPKPYVGKGIAIGNVIKPKATETDEETNRQKLDATLQTAIERIARDPKLTQDQKIQAVIEVQKQAEGKKSPSVWGGVVGAVGGAAKKVVAGPIYAMNEWADLIKPLTNTAMSAANEIEGALQTQGAKLEQKKQTGQPLSATEKIFSTLGIGGYGDEGKTSRILSNPDQYAPSWDRFVKNAGREDHYNPFFTEEKFADKSTASKLFSTVYVGAIADPLTYAGVGALNHAGRAGRVALAIRMVEKYGDDVVDVARITRYGVAGVPKALREAENLSMGIRYAGKIIPKTGGAETAFAYGRAAVGDVLQAGKYNPIRGLVTATTPKSLKGIQALNVGRRAGQGLDYEQIRPSIVQFTASKFAKGATSVAYRQAQQELVELAQRQRALVGKGLRNKAAKAVGIGARDAEALNIYRYIEMPESEMLASKAITDETKQLVVDIRAWQDKLRNSANAEIRQFGDDFGTNVTEIGFIDDYLHHKVTPEARKWMMSQQGQRSLARGEWKGSDITLKELTDNTGPLMYRKLRGEYVDPDTGEVVVETFLGQPVRYGTVDEINKIFGDATEAQGLGRLQWFETDMVSILDSYAFSISKVKGKVAFARRAFDFGDPDIIRPLIKKVVPDAELVTRLERVHSTIVKTQTRLRNRVQTNVIRLQDMGKYGVRYATKFLNGELTKKAMTTQEIAKLTRRLDLAIADLTAANVRAASIEAAKRGEFPVLNAVFLDELTNLRAAINNAERYAATIELRNIYATIYPNHNPTTLAGRSPEWLAEKIMNSKGIPATRELREVNARMRQLRAQMDAMPDGPEFTQMRASLESDYYDLENVERGYSQIASVKAEATYADDGLLYGSADDLIALPEEAGYKAFRTRPRDAGFANGDDSVAVHAIPEKELVDLRQPADLLDYFSPDNFGEDLGFALAQKGLQLEGEAFSVGYRQLIETGEYDDELAEFYPAIAMLIDTIRWNTVHVDPNDIVSDAQIVEIFESIDDAIRQIPDLADPEDVDIFAREIMEEVFGASAFRRSVDPQDPRQGLLIPSRLIDDTGPADEGFAVIFPHNHNFPRATGNPTDGVQTVKGNKLVKSILDGDYEQASLQTSLAKAAKEEEIVELEKAALNSADARAELASLGKKKGGFKSAASKRLTKTEKAKEVLARTGTVEINIGGVKQTVTREQAQKQLVKMEAQLERKLASLETEIDAVYRSEGVPRIGSKGGPKVDAVADYKERLPMLMNQARVLKDWNNTVGTVLAKDIQDLHLLVTARPPKGAAAMQSAAWARKVSRSLDAIDTIVDPSVRQAYERITNLLHADEAQLALLEGVTIPNIERQLELMKSGLVGRLVDDTLDGWTEITNLGVMMPDEIMSVWKPNLEKLRSKINQNNFLKAYDYSVQFFKTYATGTIGFFVRNGMSATFMNYVAGVGSDNIVLGFRAARAIGKGEDAWMRFLSKLDPSERELFQTAWKMTEASGRGVSDDLASVALRGKLNEKIINNRATQFIARKNDFVERAVRLPMAIDSLKRGQTYDEGVARIVRYHFDYSDLSAFDESARRFVPFWIWTSRNVPLQMVERMVHPSAYNTYNRIVEASPVGADILMPTWLSEYNPIAIAGVDQEDKNVPFLPFDVPMTKKGGQWVMTPDLPMVRLQQQLESFTNPAKLVGQLAPVIKLPAEFIAGRQLGIDVGPFKDSKVPAEGVVDKYVLATIAEIVGGEALVGIDPKTGGLVINEKVPYTAQNIFPTLGQMNRVSGGLTGGKGSYKERMLGNIANWFGIPIRYVGPDQQESQAVGNAVTIREWLANEVEAGRMTPTKELPKVAKKSTKPTQPIVLP